MPKLTLDRVPKYRKHRASGQAVVTIDGHDIYLGLHGSAVSRIEFDRLIAEWLTNGRQLPGRSDRPLRVIDLMAKYRPFVQRYYVKDHKPTSEQNAIAATMRYLRKFYGRHCVNDFGPLALKAVREQMIAAGLARGTINANVHRIRRMFRWGVENELVPAPIHQALLAVGGLRKGKSEARETAPIRPVSDSVVETTLPHLPPTVADMVRLQRLTGCRPQDVCQIRPCDVDTTGDVWICRPRSHKTEHHGHEHVVYLGPRAQSILRPHLLRYPNCFCFAPSDSERKRRAERHANRKTPLHYGNRPGTNRCRRPKRGPGDRYDTNAYRRAITRACEIAFGMPDELRKGPSGESPDQCKDRQMRAGKWRALHVWSPNQLRHTAATEIRRQFGLEAAQVVLGHAQADITQLYAERNERMGVEVMKSVG